MDERNENGDPYFTMPSVATDDGRELGCRWPTRCLETGEHDPSQCYTVETDEDAINRARQMEVSR